MLRHLIQLSSFFSPKPDIQAVDMKEKQVIYYDPMGSSPRDCYDFSHTIR